MFAVIRDNEETVAELLKTKGILVDVSHKYSSTIQI